MASPSLTQALKDEARRVGFDLAGACPACRPPGIERFRQWLAAGYAGAMRYLPDRAEAYEHPESVLEGVQSILVLGSDYRTAEPAEARAGEGRVSRYAWGRDYHDVIHARLRRLAETHLRITPGAAVRGVVDTAPLMEREFGRLAGLGWIGKNTLLLNRQLGSWFFLAALLTTEPLDHDEPFEVDHCGSCRACLDACPTGALVDAYRLDARKCISYLTIELKSASPPELHEARQGWLFGCDVCQDVCPWNGRTPTCAEDAFQPAPERNPVPLARLFALDEPAFRERFRHTPLWRPRRRGLLANAAIVLGNCPDPEALPGLLRGLHDEETPVRAACAWALGRYGQPEAQKALRERLSVESDIEVRREIEAALS
ncbi:MAG: tRNA epoxyqueuosine(34) reductase QueG [Planctomycetota bacterium]|jgi:epoxyqueuosine reductase